MSENTEQAQAAKAEVIKYMRHHAQMMESVRTLIKDSLEPGALYTAFRSPDPDRWGKVTLEQATQFVMSKLNRVPNQSFFSLAVHRILLESPTYFLNNSTRSSYFHVVPINQARNYQDVSSWIDQSDPRIGSFVEKAIDIIQTSRRIYQESLSLSEGNIEPVPDLKHTFSEDDQKIIQFIHSSMYRVRKSQGNPYEVYTNRLFRLIDMHDVASGDIGFQFLTELGVLTRWEPVSVHQLEMKDRINLINDSQQALAGEAQTLALQGLPRSANGAKVYNDGVDSVRHDWGDLPVYIIDDHGAIELDDGISIEKVNDGSDCYWVHAHIADPTCVLRPGDALDKVARQLGITLYSQEYTSNMLPSTLTGLSLGTTPDNPQPVLTFSTKVDRNGQVIERTVRPGLVRNTQILRYDDVDAALSMPPPRMKYWFNPPNSSQTAPKGDASAIPSSALDDLNTMRELASALHADRIRQGLAKYSMYQYNTKLNVEASVMQGDLAINRPIYYRGSPRISIGVTCDETRMGLPSEGSRMVIAEFMTLACVTAACFARDNRIPVLYRASSEMSAAQLEARRRLRDPTTGMLPIAEELMGQTATFLGLRPTALPLLGTGHDPYCRVTSPLRRYSDMVNHWQFKAFLDPSKPKAPFQPDVLLPLANRLTWLEVRCRKQESSSETGWKTVAIRRALHRGDGSAEQLKNLNGIVFSEHRYKDGEWWCRILIPELGVSAHLRGLTTEEMERLKFGSRVKVDLYEVPDGLTQALRTRLAQ
ncbi:hypothetical protein FRC02_012172 [Tulasnella sp. 418]|nr:hypothetical protein FRC02_012172 [Tulasnella sp. 418]